MNHKFFKCFIVSFIFIFIISILFSYNNFHLKHDNQINNNYKLDYTQDKDFFRIPKEASSEPNGRPLLAHQFANISKTFEDVSSNENISFPLAPDWTSKNVTINYEGVCRQKQWITNGHFTDDANGWEYIENDDYNSHFYAGGHANWDVGGHVGTLKIGLIGSSDEIPEDNYAGYQQIFSISSEAMSSNLAVVSFDYYYDISPSPPPNGDYPDASLYLAVFINGVEKNITLNLDDITMDTWETISVQYDAKAHGQTLPGDVSIFIGICMNSGSYNTVYDDLFIDNIKLTLYTELNNTEGLIKTYDTEFNQNYTYYNIDYGKGYSFIGEERCRETYDNVIFTVYENISPIMDFLDFKIDTVTITSPAIIEYNSTILNKIGSKYTLGENISWELEFKVSSFPDEYVSWMEIDKPSYWSFYSILDSYETEKIINCLGTDFGSNKLTIESSDLISGKWKLKAFSTNFITKANIGLENSNEFINANQLTFGDIFQINITLNNTISLPNTEINCTIYYPNTTILWHDNKEPTSYNFKFGNLTVGKNMTNGKYLLEVIWTNDKSFLNREDIGFIELSFTVWHHTNLTAVNVDFEMIAGDPLLLRVKYMDYDINEPIAFATVRYNSTFGSSGTMIYEGLGIYFIDLDTSSLGLGDYYFSFNASKIYYENQSVNDLIHLKIIPQPLAIKVPNSAINEMGNSYAICQINVTGALTGALITDGVNISTDWSIGYTVLEHFNGTYTLNFSTNGLPKEGILQSYIINVFANKTNFGSTSNFITLIIHPIPTSISVNKSFYNVYLNEMFFVKINYSLEETGAIVSEANWEITWASMYNVLPVVDGYIVRFNTLGLLIDVYTAVIKMEKAGYETEFISITAIVNTQDVDLTVQINSAEIKQNSLIELFFKEKINISARVFAVGEKIYLSGVLITWISDYFEKNLTESPLTYFNSSIIMNKADFDTGINYIYIKFQQNNYTTRIFSFQLFLSEQAVNLTVYINDEKIRENLLIDLYFKDTLNISARAFALGELEFLSGGIITWISDNFEKNLTESPLTYFNSSIIMDGAKFNSGLNYVYLRFQQANYTTKTFSFQLFVRTQSINLTLFIDSKQVQENYLIEKYFNEQLSLSCRAYAEAEQLYLPNCSIIFINGYYEQNLTECVNYWYNDSIVISTAHFELGINYVYIKFIRANYSTTTFSFQIQVQQIKIDLETIDFDKSIEAYLGESKKIEIKLVEEFSNFPIEGAKISYEWDFGVGEFDEVGNGVYEVEIEIPENIEEGNYKIILIVSKSGGIYKTSEYELIIDVNEREVPEYWIWILFVVLLAVLGLLASLSLRAYVFLPKKRKKERDLLSKTQNFKDMRSIQALMLIHRLSGLPLYQKTYNFLEEEDTNLFSGFIQAITAIGLEIAQKESREKFAKKQIKFAEHMMELDFKYFYALIYDHKELRIVFILSERSSESLREKIKIASERILEELKELLESFRGDLKSVENFIVPVFYNSIDLYYKGPFKLAHDHKIEKTHHLASMEKRLINVIRSYTKANEPFLLKDIFKMISEKNEDFVIEAIEGLIKKEIFVPTTENIEAIKGKIIN